MDLSCPKVASVFTSSLGEFYQKQKDAEIVRVLLEPNGKIRDEYNGDL